VSVVHRFSPERLRGARDRAGLSREQLAVATGRSADTVELWERGKVQPPRRIVGLIAAALGVSVDDLYDLAVPA
jgi:transcriptional regulator with XRE-family HTH domain